MSVFYYVSTQKYAWCLHRPMAGDEFLYLP